MDVHDRRTGRVYRGLNVFEDSGDIGADYLSRRRLPNTTRVDTVTYITLTSSSAYVAFRTEVVNAARDHRLRALFPTGVKTGFVHA